MRYFFYAMIYVCVYTFLPLHYTQCSRPSSYPFISGDTFRSIADHIVDEEKLPFDPIKVQPYDIIFLKTDYVADFFEILHPQIINPYILITHNGDVSPIYLTANSHPWRGYDMSKYLDDQKLVVWFAQNIDYKHPKLKPIPIGIANSCYAHGKKDVFLSAMKNVSAFKDKLNKVYLNFTINNNAPQRRPALEFFRGKPFAYITAPKGMDQYLTEMKQYRYVISPPGNGLDCHRAWEALLMGCVPIMKHSAIDPLFEELPVIFVDHWSEVTVNFLEEKSRDMGRKTYNLNKIYAQYWIDLIKSFQQKGST